MYLSLQSFYCGLFLLLGEDKRHRFRGMTHIPTSRWGILVSRMLWVFFSHNLSGSLIHPLINSLCCEQVVMKRSPTLRNWSQCQSWRAYTVVHSNKKVPLKYSFANVTLLARTTYSSCIELLSVSKGREPCPISNEPYTLLCPLPLSLHLHVEVRHINPPLCLTLWFLCAQTVSTTQHHNLSYLRQRHVCLAALFPSPHV